MLRETGLVGSAYPVASVVKTAGKTESHLVTTTGINDSLSGGVIWTTVVETPWATLSGTQYIFYLREWDDTTMFGTSSCLNIGISLWRVSEPQYT